MRDSGGAKRSFPVPANPSHGALGEAGVRAHPAPAAHHETAPVPAGQTAVRET